jgi:transposase
VPRRTDNIPLQDPFLDRRTKLLPCQKEMVKYWHDKGTSINGLARMFKVSKRTIQFILFPERQKKNVQDRQERGGWKQYYNKEKHAKDIKEHRDYKKETLKNIPINGEGNKTDSGV